MNKQLEQFELSKQDLIEPTIKYFPVDPSKPAICMIGWHSCIRLTKQAIALAKQGWRLGLLTNRQPTGINVFDKTYIFSDDAQLQRMIEEIKDKYDLFHVHNEPNALFIRTKDIIKNKPVILDVHDSDLLRRGHCKDDEIMAFSHADATVHVSEPIREYITNIYNYQKPSITLESRCSIDFLIEDKEHSRFGIVYEGGVRAPEDVNDFSYRNIWPICNAFSKEGYDFHMYGPTIPLMKQKYEEAGVTVHGGKEYLSLLLELSKYEWGFSGFIQDPPKKHIRWASTNKFWEYINAGTPLIVYNTEVQAEMVEKYRIGVVLRSIKGIRNQLESYDWEELHKNLLAIREEVCMEKHIYKLENLYYKVLNK
jgi:hypothetical protein